MRGSYGSVHRVPRTRARVTARIPPRPHPRRGGSRMSVIPRPHLCPTGDIRPISGGGGTDRAAHRSQLWPGSPRFAPGSAQTRGGPGPRPPRPGSGSSEPARRPGPYRLPAGSGRRGPPPGPVRRLRGMRRRCSPSPLCPVQRADPRSTHASAPAGTGRERTAGRTATRREHARTPPDEAPAAAAETARKDAGTRAVTRIGAGRRAEGGRRHPLLPVPPHQARGVRPLLPGAVRRSPHRSAGGPHRPSPVPPLPLPRSSALPSRGVRLPLAHRAPSAPRAARLPPSPRRWPVRTRIPPYGRPALNGRDVANYAGFTDVLSRAAYSSGLGHMRVRPECRGSSLGRTRYECRAPHR